MKTLLHKVIFWSIVLLSPFYLTGQEFGGNPAYQKWNQINTDLVRVIYPPQMYSQANRIANQISVLDNEFQSSIGNKKKKINLVLQNNSTISNGYVGLAPFRSEFYTAAPRSNFDLSSSNWLDLLTIHEYRHVMQTTNLNHGLSSIIKTLFGEFAYSGAINLSIPDWYFEGDAVQAETAFTNGGRGRVPSFMKEYKSLVMENGKVDYSLFRNGSMRRITPDQYPLGYVMTSFVTNKKGTSIWPTILKESSSYQGLFYPFSQSLKKHTGHSSKSLFEVTTDSLRQLWVSQRENSSYSASEELIPNGKHPQITHYRFPSVFEDEVYFSRSSLDKINSIFRLKDGISTRLFSQGLVTNRYISQKKGLFTWSEIQFHSRWGNEDYGVVMTYDVRTNQKKQLTFKSRYFSPDISHDRSKIIVIKHSATQEQNLVILNSTTGSVVAEIANKEGYHITYPKWDVDDQSIIMAVSRKDGAMAIVSLDLETAISTELTPFEYQPIGIPAVGESKICYSKSEYTSEKIFSLDRENGEVMMVCEKPYGAYHPAFGANEDELLFAAYTVDGYRLHKMAITAKQTSKSSPDKYANHSFHQYGTPLIVPEDGEQLEEERYGKLSRPLNFHSWGIDASFDDLSFVLQSENILNNVQFRTGYTYDLDRRNGLFLADVSIAAWYPTLTFQYTREKRDFTNPENDRVFNWHDNNISARISVPWNFSQGLFIRSLRPVAGIDFSLIRGDIELDVTSSLLGLTFVNQQIKAPQNLFSHFGQAISLQYKKSLDDLVAEQFIIETDFSFRGLMPNHNLILELDYKDEPLSNDYFFTDIFDYSRGFPAIASDNFFRFGINYHLPILYPDFDVLGIGFLKRIRGNVFYDYSKGTLDGNSATFNSMGVEGILDIRIFRAQEFSFGFRYSRRLKFDQNHFEVFIPFSRL